MPPHFRTTSNFTILFGWSTNPIRWPILAFVLLTATSLTGCRVGELLGLRPPGSHKFVAQQRHDTHQPVVANTSASANPAENGQLASEESIPANSVPPEPDESTDQPDIRQISAWRPTKNKSTDDNHEADESPRLLVLDDTAEQADVPIPPSTPAEFTEIRRPLVLDFDAGEKKEEKQSISASSEIPPAPAVEEITASDEEITVDDAESIPTVSEKSTSIAEEGIFPTEEQEGYPIDLPNVLRLAGAQNWSIQLAAERVREARANLTAAKVQWLPSLNAAVGYNKHEGQIQDTQGDVINVNRNSLFAGGGAVVDNAPVTGGSGGPARMFVDLSLADAIFEPLAAKQLVTAERARESATFNDTLLASSLAYYDLVNAQGRVSITNSNLHDATEVLKLTESFVAAGKGSQADTARARVEVSVRRQAVVQADMNTHVAAAELARQLQLAPETALLVWEDRPVSVELVDESATLQALIEQAQSSRPEVVEQYARTEAGSQRARAERWRPFIPSLYLGISAGGFGGGINDELNRFDGRADYDALAVWQVKNLGFGTQAAQQQSSSQYRQELLASYRVVDLVATEVTKAYYQVRAHKERIGLAETNVKQATESYQKNIARIRGLAGMPLEAIQSLQAVAQAREAYLSAVIDYNQAQLRLLRGIGEPISQ